MVLRLTFALLLCEMHMDGEMDTLHINTHMEKCGVILQFYGLLP